MLAITKEQHDKLNGIGTVLAMRGPRQSGKGSALIGGGILVAKACPTRWVVYVAPVHMMMRQAVDEHSKDAPGNFLWFTGHNLKKLEKRLEEIMPTLILLDEAQLFKFRGASQLANRLAKKFKTSVWFTENECDYCEGEP